MIRPRSVATVMKIQQKLDSLRRELKTSQQNLAVLEDGFERYSRSNLVFKLTIITDPKVKKRIKFRLESMAYIASVQLSIVRFENVLDKLTDVRTEGDSAQSDGTIKTTVTNQNMEDAPGSDMKMETAGDTVNSQQGQRNVLAMDDFLSRPVQIYSGQLSLATDISIILDVWDLFTLVPSIRAKIRNYAYLRGDLHVRIVVSGTPFHYGRLLASYQPYAHYNETILNSLTNISVDNSFRPLFINYLSQALGSSVINVNENKPVAIKCPFISSKPMHRLYNYATTAISAGTSLDDFANAGDLYIYSINQIACIGTSPTPIYIQVYAWMEEVELGTNTATQIEITTEGSDERKVGPVETLASRVYSISSALADTGFIGPYASASAALSYGIAKVASLFGWSRPVKEVDPVYVKSLPLMNGANTIGFDTPFRVTLDPHQELTVDPRITGISDDEMALNNIASRVSYFETFSWLDTDAALGPPIWTVRVTPCSVTNVTIGTKVISQPTAMAFAAFPFQFWRGSITYRVEVVCSAFHRGKLAVYYEPNISQIALITPTLELNKQFLEIVDIQETQVFEVTLNWASYRPWLLVNTSAGAYINNTDPTNAFQSIGYCNGFLAITPFTKLQSPDSSDIQLNVYTYSNDVAFNVMSSTNLHTERIETVVPAGLVEEAKVTTEGNSSNPSVETTVLDLNLSSASTLHIAEEYFGEMPLSFRALLKRYVTNNVVVAAADATAVPKYLQLAARIFPINNSAYGSTTYPYTDLFSYLYYAYLGIKGSIRYRAHPTNGFALAGYHQFRASIDAPSTSFATAAATTVAGGTIARLAGTVTFVPLTQGGSEFEFPYYSSNLFQISFSDSLQGNVGNDDYCATWSRNFKYTMESGTASQPAISVVLDVAAGEDFSFLRFQGAPYYSGDPIA